MTQPRTGVRPARWRPLVRVGLPALALLALSGCGDTPQNALDPASEFARKLDRLWDASFIIAAVIFFVVEGLLVYALIRFRNRGDDAPAPKQVHGSTPLEIGWTIVPALILAALAVPTVATIFDLDERPAGALEVTVVGHHWWWEFDYGEDVGVITANELHIPEDRPVNLTLLSCNAFSPEGDCTEPSVIHSFWVPQLAGKLDVTPGHTNHLTLAADEPGLYLGQCAEFCGISHANMRVRVIAHTAEGFDRWLAEQQQPAERPTSGLAATGYDLFASKGCNSCHSIEGHEASGGARVGPDLTHLQSRSTFAGAIFDLTADNLRRWLEDPPKMKPMQPEDGVGMPAEFPPGPGAEPLSDEEIEALVAYLETLE